MKSALVREISASEFLWFMPERLSTITRVSLVLRRRSTARIALEKLNKKHVRTLTLGAPRDIIGL